MKVSKFSDDVKLLADLQAIITEEEKTANPPAYARDLFGSISPVLKKAMPATIAKAKKRIAVLTRAKKRLEELLDQVEK